MEENVWHLINLNGDNHRYLNLDKDQMVRVHFGREPNGPKFFIILPVLPEFTGWNVTAPDKEPKYRMRRGKKVLIPEEWAGKIPHKRTMNKRKSRETISKRTRKKK